VGLEELHYPHGCSPDNTHCVSDDAAKETGDDDDGDDDNSVDTSAYTGSVYTSYDDDQDSHSEYGPDDPADGLTGGNGDNDYDETTTTTPTALTNDDGTAPSRLSPQHTEQDDEGDADNPNSVTKSRWPNKSSFPLLQSVRVPQEIGVLLTTSKRSINGSINGLLESVDPEEGTGYVTFGGTHDGIHDGTYDMLNIGRAVLVYRGIECRLCDVNIVDEVSGSARLVLARSLHDPRGAPFFFLRSVRLLKAPESTTFEPSILPYCCTPPHLPPLTPTQNTLSFFLLFPCPWYLINCTSLVRCWGRTVPHPAPTCAAPSVVTWSLVSNLMTSGSIWAGTSAFGLAKFCSRR